jgi:hypothetical protein
MFTQGQPALFVINMRKIDIEALDIDLVLYHVLKVSNVAIYQRPFVNHAQLLTTGPYVSREFEIIVDFTSFSSWSEIPMQWLKYCVEMFPADVRRRFKQVHFLNLNQFAHKYLRKLFNVSAGPFTILQNAICSHPFRSGVGSNTPTHAYASVAELRQEVPAAAGAALNFAGKLSFVL